MVQHQMVKIFISNLTGTLAANRTVTVPDSAERIMVFEDATTRESSGTIKTLTIKTVSGTGYSSFRIKSISIFRCYKCKFRFIG